MRTGVSPKRIATRSFCCLIPPCTSARLSLLLRNSSRSAVRPISVHAFRQYCVQARSCRKPCQMHGSLATRQQCNPYFFFLRKEVIQPHLPIRLPCYDFTPVITPAFGSSFLSVRSLTSGIRDSHGVTGGVYKTRERIHRDILIRDY